MKMNFGVVAGMAALLLGLNAMAGIDQQLLKNEAPASAKVSCDAEVVDDHRKNTFICRDASTPPAQLVCPNGKPPAGGDPLKCLPQCGSRFDPVTPHTPCAEYRCEEGFEKSPAGKHSPGTCRKRVQTKVYECSHGFMLMRGKEAFCYADKGDGQCPFGCTQKTGSGGDACVAAIGGGSCSGGRDLACPRGTVKVANAHEDKRDRCIDFFRPQLQR